MKKSEFIKSKDLSVKDLKKLWREKYPWVTRMKKVPGGYIAYLE